MAERVVGVAVLVVSLLMLVLLLSIMSRYIGCWMREIISIQDIWVAVVGNAAAAENFGVVATEAFEEPGLEGLG